MSASDLVVAEDGRAEELYDCRHVSLSLCVCESGTRDEGTSVSQGRQTAGRRRGGGGSQL